MKNDIIVLLALYGGYRIIKDICIYFIIKIMQKIRHKNDMTELN